MSAWRCTSRAALLVLIGHHSAKAGFFWAGCTALCLLWAFFRLPESKNFTYAELDLLYERKVPARKFKQERQAVSEQMALQ